MELKSLFALYAAEFVGTFFLVFFGCGAVVAGASDILVPFAFGGAVAVMIYAVGHISGAHFNPAVTVAFCVQGKMPVQRLWGYIAFQCAGALAASLAHLWIWGGDHSFAATLIQVSSDRAVFVELVLSFALMFVIMSVATDSRAVGEMAGLAIGGTVIICAVVGGSLTGASMNPARSLGPALVSYFSSGDLTAVTNLWLYLTVPVLGTVAGAKVYDFIRCESTKSDGQGCC